MIAAFYASPIEPLEILSTGSHITSIKFIEKEDMTSSMPEPDILLDQCFQQLDEYFMGSRKEFTFPIHQEGTDFQKQVWTQLLTIPYGITISYAELSRQLIRGYQEDPCRRHN